MKRVIRYVTVKLEAIGLHHWPEAPEAVSFLRDKHRHVFGIRIRLPVEHGDRQVEFILLEREVRQWLPLAFEQMPNGDYDFGRSSCEDIALEVATFVLESYPSLRWCECAVDEDGGHEGTVLVTEVPNEELDS